MKALIPLRVLIVLTLLFPNLYAENKLKLDINDPELVSFLKNHIGKPSEKLLIDITKAGYNYNSLFKVIDTVGYRRMGFCISFDDRFEINFYVEGKFKNLDTIPPDFNNFCKLKIQQIVVEQFHSDTLGNTLCETIYIPNSRKETMRNYLRVEDAFCMENYFETVCNDNPNVSDAFRKKCCDSSYIKILDDYFYKNYFYSNTEIGFTFCKDILFQKPKSLKLKEYVPRHIITVVGKQTKSRAEFHFIKINDKWLLDDIILDADKK